MNETFGDAARVCSLDGTEIFCKVLVHNWHSELHAETMLPQPNTAHVPISLAISTKMTLVILVRDRKRGHGNSNTSVI